MFHSRSMAKFFIVFLKVFFQIKTKGKKILMNFEHFFASPFSADASNRSLSVASEQSSSAWTFVVIRVQNIQFKYSLMLRLKIRYPSLELR